MAMLLAVLIVLACGGCAAPANDAVDEWLAYVGDDGNDIPEAEEAAAQ